MSHRTTWRAATRAPGRCLAAVAVGAALLVTTSAPVQAQPVLVTGSVAGAVTGVVFVYVWPDSAASGLTSSGARVELPLVARSTVENGAFSVPAPEDSLAIATQAAHNGGYANFMISVVAGDRSGAYFVLPRCRHAQ